jgi:hypothetical protein
MVLGEYSVLTNHRDFVPSLSSQAYTGLSRATSLSSVRVVSVIPGSFVTSPKVLEFYNAVA